MLLNACNCSQATLLCVPVMPLLMTKLSLSPNWGRVAVRNTDKDLALWLPCLCSSQQVTNLYVPLSNSDWSSALLTIAPIL